MSWSFKLGRLFGIPLYMHWTFLILLAWIAFGHYRQSGDVGVALAGVGFVMAVFGCVVLHELGHALAARRYGIPTADITLLPIGGVARLQRIPEKPAQELVVALAGPAVNVVIAGIAYLVVTLTGARQDISMNEPTFLVRDDFWTRLLMVNLFLVLFNLLPAFPMDGGRVLRALLAMRLDYGRATRIAASVGQMMAIVFVFLGLSSNPMLLLIALFVWIGAEAEASQVQERIAMRDVPVRSAMLTDYATLTPVDSLGRAADLLLAGSQHDFPVVIDGQLGGVLTRQALLAALAQGGRDALVGDAALVQLGQVAIDSPLIGAVQRLREGGEPCLQVTDGPSPVGLLTLENVGEYLMIRAALGDHPGGSPRPAPVGV
jgi:Zn-dependent protease/CBS domain-containing protein